MVRNAGRFTDVQEIRARPVILKLERPIKSGFFYIPTCRGVGLEWDEQAVKARAADL